MNDKIKRARDKALLASIELRPTRKDKELDVMLEKARDLCIDIVEHVDARVEKHCRPDRELLAQCHPFFPSLGF